MITPHLDVPRRPLSKDTRGVASGRKNPKYHGSAGHPLYLVGVSNYAFTETPWCRAKLPESPGSVLCWLSNGPAVASPLAYFKHTNNVRACVNV